MEVGDYEVVVFVVGSDDPTVREYRGGLRRFSLLMGSR